MARSSTKRSPQLETHRITWRDHFTHFAQKVAHATGTPAAFFVAAGVVIIWTLSGPLFDFSDTWQLVINTGTTIATFLMVFLIQNTQNRDAVSFQIKLSELIFAMRGADNKLARVEELSDEELEQIHRHYLSHVEQIRTVLEERTTSRSPKKK